MAADDRSTSGSGGYGGPGAEMDDTADRIDHTSWDRFAPRSGIEAGDGEEEAGMLHSLLEEQLRVRPLPTLLAALALGWVVGKLLR